MTKWKLLNVMATLSCCMIFGFIVYDVNLFSSLVELTPALKKVYDNEKRAVKYSSSSTNGISDENALEDNKGEENISNHASSLHTDDDDIPDLLLSVPYYVYEDLAWTNATLNGVPMASTSRKYTKHSDDYWFMISSLKHPMRTHNISEAKLFFVPWLLNDFDSKSFYKDQNLCWCGKCDLELFYHAVEQLQSKSTFQRYPERHLVVRSNWSANADWWNKYLIKSSPYSFSSKNKNNNETSDDDTAFLDVLSQMNTVVFEDRMPYAYYYDRTSSYRHSLIESTSHRLNNKSHLRGLQHQHQPQRRHQFTSYYVGHPCELNDPPNKEKLYDVAMIASLYHEKECFHDRRMICEWLSSSSSPASLLNSSQAMTRHHNNNNNITIKFICGEGLSQCPSLAQSKFVFHVPGDTYRSQRVMDSILSGSVPIFTHLQQYHILGSWIDWKQLTYYLPIHSAGDEANTSSSSAPEFVHPDLWHHHYYETIHYGDNNEQNITNQLITQDIFLKYLNNILQDEEGYKKRYNAVLQHIPLFDYKTLYPFDTYMYLLQAQLYPGTRQSKSKWSALILPPRLYF